MRIIVNKTFEEIAPGDDRVGPAQLQAGDVRAWEAAFGDVELPAAPGESQAAAGIVTAILTALVGSVAAGTGRLRSAPPRCRSRARCRSTL